MTDMRNIYPLPSGNLTPGYVHGGRPDFGPRVMTVEEAIALVGGGEAQSAAEVDLDEVEDQAAEE